jgi:predicted nucleic acid-binding protein
LIGSIATSCISVDRFALDTNVLAHVVDDGAGDKQGRARDVFTRAAANPGCILAMQCVGEFYTAATRKRLVARAPRRTAPAI